MFNYFYCPYEEYGLSRGDLYSRPLNIKIINNSSKTLYLDQNYIMSGVDITSVPQVLYPKDVKSFSMKESYSGAIGYGPRGLLTYYNTVSPFAYTSVCLYYNHPTSADDSTYHGYSVPNNFNIVAIADNGQYQNQYGYAYWIDPHKGNNLSLGGYVQMNYITAQGHSQSITYTITDK